MTPERGRPSTAAAILSGAAFGAAAVFAVSGAVAGAWPTGGAALVGALVLAALGATLLAAARRGGSARGAATDAPPSRTAKTDEDAGPGPVGGAGRGSLVAAAAVWVLALLAGGIWAVAGGDDDGTAQGGAPAKPGSSSASPDTRPAVPWTIPPAGQVYDEGVGSWGLGATVAHGRIDGLFAYGSADGAVRWSVPAPRREALCAMSPGIGEGVGLVAHGRHDKPCATLLAVRVSDGTVLWKRTLGGAGLVARGLAVGGASAVVAEDGAVRARAADTGDRLWERALPAACVVRALDADAARTLVVEQCGEAARIVALDTRTGAQRWTRDLAVESKALATVVSVTPAVIAVDEADARGTHAFLAFDAKGAPTVSVPLTGPAGVLSAGAGVGDGMGFFSRPLVLGDLLVTLAERDEIVPDTVVAHSLKDGRTVWSRTLEHQTLALTAEPDGRIGVLENERSGAVALLDRATGRVRQRLVAHTGKTVDISHESQLHAVPGGHVVLNQLLMQTEPAAFALR
ncbi:outer membrane protein assembly factor BamB family protein [Streptomyces sp. NPDC003327]